MSKLFFLLVCGLCLASCAAPASQITVRSTMPEEYARAVYTEALGWIEVCAASPPTLSRRPETPSTNTLELVTFDFRGCRLGQAINPTALINQGFQCSAGVIYESQCQKLQDRIGDMHVSVFYFLEHGHFAMLDIVFHHDLYRQVLDAFIAKLGPPHQTDHEPVQNRMGASFMNEKAIWFTTTGKLEISSYGSRLDHGSVIIAEPSLEEVANQRQKAQGVSAAKDL